MECRCDTPSELYGREAEEDAADHLALDETRSERLEELYACSETGSTWLLEYPERTGEELGAARLRRDPRSS